MYTYTYISYETENLLKIVFINFVDQEFGDVWQNNFYFMYLLKFPLTGCLGIMQVELDFLGISLDCKSFYVFFSAGIWVASRETPSSVLIFPRTKRTNDLSLSICEKQYYLISILLLLMKWSEIKFMVHLNHPTLYVCYCICYQYVSHHLASFPSVNTE